MTNRDAKGRFMSTKEKVYAVGFKGFEPGMICRGKQYAENTVFEEPEAELCNKGMHFCENPLDVFKYYAPVQNGKIAEFASVEALAPCKGDDDKKCTTKLRIGAKLTLGGLIEAAVKLVFSRVKKKGAATNTGDQSAATNTGWRSAATNTGWRSAATNTGDQSAATNTGDQSAATNTGVQSAATNTGWRSAATNTGDRSAAAVEGKESFAITMGVGSKVKGAKGCFIACAEWKEIDGEYHPVAFISGKVDGQKLKADTWYTVKNGKFVEVEE